MNWSQKPPEETKEFIPSLKGPRSSGRTEALIQSVKSLRGSALIITPWPWEKSRWETALKNRPYTSIHTPESLARTILEKWERKNGKILLWEDREHIMGNDPEEQARNMLMENKMSAGTAHWLLKENFCSEFLPQGLEILALDDEECWEPEARLWIQRIKREKTLRTSRGPGITWLPGKKPRKQRFAEISWTDSGAGQWTIEQLENIPKKQKPTLLVIQTEKDKWKAYLQSRGITADIRHAAECEARNWKTALIPSLKKQWGGPKLAREWLDLAASRTENPCKIRIGPEGPPYWLPKTTENPPYLVWDPQ